MRTWGYDVTTVIEAGDVLAELQQDPYDLVLIMPSPDSRTWTAFNQAAEDAREMQRQRSSEIRLYDPAGFLRSNPEIAMGVPLLPVSAKGIQYLREAIRISLSRKRGPKKCVGVAA